MKILVDVLPETTDKCLFYIAEPVRGYESLYRIYCSVDHQDCPGVEKCDKLKEGEVHESIDASVKNKT